MFGPSDHAVVSGVKRCSGHIHTVVFACGGRCLTIVAQRRTQFLANRSHGVDDQVRSLMEFEVVKKRAMKLTKIPREEEIKGPSTTE